MIAINYTFQNRTLIIDGNTGDDIAEIKGRNVDFKLNTLGLKIKYPWTQLFSEIGVLATVLEKM